MKTDAGKKLEMRYLPSTLIFREDSIFLPCLPGLLTIIFIVLRVAHYIDWSWWWVLLPILIQVGFWVAFIAVVLVVSLVEALQGWLSKMRTLKARRAQQHAQLLAVEQNLPRIIAGEEKNAEVGLRGLLDELKTFGPSRKFPPT